MHSPMGLHDSIGYCGFGLGQWFIVAITLLKIQTQLNRFSLIVGVQK
jgi:hypothetical protein